MTFTAIDFETAHALYPCEIGITQVENGIITQVKSWLIKPPCFPYMNPFYERIHGISSMDVAEAPNFEELWKDIKPEIEDRIIVAHNAGFDMEVLKTALKYYDLAAPWIDYFCSLSLSRKVWKKLPDGHSLGALCKYHNIQFNHHRAGDDAEACAKIVLNTLNEVGVHDLEAGLMQLNVPLKRFKI